MAFEFLTLTRSERIAWLSLNRPDCGNALSLDLMRELTGACRDFSDDTETRVVVIRGLGRHFSVGADLKDPQRQPSDARDPLRTSRNSRIGRDLLQAILDIPQVTIAAVHGAAAGGAACIASACDFRLGSSDCRIGYPEVKLGMNLSWGALPLCYNLVGPAITRRLVMGGELEPAANLLAWGFLDEMVAPDALEARAAELAASYAAKPALAVQMIKRGINALQLAAAGTMHADGDQLTLATLTEDFQQQRAAFLDRHKPG